MTVGSHARAGIAVPSELRRHVHEPDPFAMGSVLRAITIAVAQREPGGRALAVLRADLRGHVGFHDRLHQHAHCLAQEVEVRILCLLA